MNRRGALAVIAATMAGCATTPTPAPDYDLAVTVQNEADRAYAVAVTITGEDDASVLERSITVPAKTIIGLSETVPAGRYTVTIDLDGRTSVRGFWPTANCETFQIRTSIDAAGQVRNAVRCADATTPVPASGASTRDR